MSEKGLVNGRWSSQRKLTFRSSHGPALWEGAAVRASGVRHAPRNGLGRRQIRQAGALA